MSFIGSDEPVPEPNEEVQGGDDVGRPPMGAPILVNDHTLVEAIVIGMSNLDIADVLGVSVRTISRRRNRPEFRRILRARSYEVNAELRQDFQCFLRQVSIGLALVHD